MPSPVRGWWRSSPDGEHSSADNPLHYAGSGRWRSHFHRQQWADHYEAAFTMKTYVHASDDDLKQGRQALAKIHKIV